ncbi:MAG: hypothetical protein STSR0004_07290 [Peptococcaceae bacterium]
METPLHMGSGNDLGVIDLPVQREKHTGFPKVEASGLKGCMREAFNSLVLNEEKPRVAALEERFPCVKEKRPNKDGETEYHYALEIVFGPEKGDLHAGALGFTDARLLLFPVRSALGVFAWITCPGVIVKFIKELKLGEVKNLPCAPEASTVPEDSGLLCKENKVILEEYTFPAPGKYFLRFGSDISCAYSRKAEKGNICLRIKRRRGRAGILAAWGAGGAPVRGQRHHWQGDC